MTDEYLTSTPLPKKSSGEAKTPKKTDVEADSDKAVLEMQLHLAVQVT